jgi:hypothetical protein
VVLEGEDVGIGGIGVGEGHTDLDTLSQGMRDGKLGHVVVLVSQRDKVIVYPRLVLPRVVKVKVLRLHVVGGKLLQLKLGNLLEEPRLLGLGHAPYDDDAVVKQEHLGRVHLDVKVRYLGRGVVLVVHEALAQQVLAHQARDAAVLVVDTARYRLVRPFLILLLWLEFVQLVSVRRVGRGIPSRRVSPLVVVCRVLALLALDVVVRRIDALVYDLGVRAS